MFFQKKISHNPDLNQRPLAYKANALTNWAIMAVILLVIKIKYKYLNYIKRKLFSF